MTYRYPLSVSTLGEEEIEAATAVLRSGNTTMGEKVEEFEEAFARKVGVPHAIMVNSGSSADFLIAQAMDIDGEVIIPAVTWPTHVWAWDSKHRTTVRFCDVDGLNTNAELIADQIDPLKTRAISLVHLMGIPVAMDGILHLVAKHKLVLTEDCCEALGAYYNDKPVGWYSDAAAWSFFFSHHLSTMEGGMVTTPHEDIADKCRSMRSHGWTRYKSAEKYTFEGPGFNLRPTEVNAAIGLVQLDKLDAMNQARRDNYLAFYRGVWKHPGIELLYPPERAQPSMFGIPFFVKDGRRDDLAKHLESNGIETRPILAGGLRSQPGFRGFYFGKTPGADRVTEEGLFIGLHPTVGTADTVLIAKMIEDYL